MGSCARRTKWPIQGADVTPFAVIRFITRRIDGSLAVSVRRIKKFPSAVFFDSRVKFSNSGAYHS
jgi:hypothetical protein